MEKIEVVAKMSNACDFILQFPDGTQVGMERLSRSALQSMVKNLYILLLDEVTGPRLGKREERAGSA
ncbi:hypothetical protein PR003_g28586 [Phytophthora rubi]|uniref:Uncharacterized protein n=1 Tax=Phytophthora rubi TaxID=129364 RepID=A0A6A4BRP7_9STRA|nr:hypothetical protein PR003_g28586 [Phytophthora rubi]